MQVSRRAFLGSAAALALLRDGFAAPSGDMKVFAPNGGQAADFLICRRLYLDICGRIPTPEEVSEYTASRDVKKREKLVDYDHTRVATKFPHIAEQFFNKHGMQMEYIKLNGSIELGPIVGLSESIVDIVETGTTLRENDLEEIAYILDATARLIVNRVSFKLKFDRISQLTEELRKILELEQQAKAEA